MIKILLFVFDLAVATFMIPLAACLVFFIVLARALKKIKSGNILHISGGASSNSLLNKFSSFDFLFKYDGDATNNIFRKNILFWFPSENTLRFDFDNGWIILEQRRAFGVFPVIGIISFAVRAAMVIHKEDIILIRGWDPYISGLFAWFYGMIFKIPFCISIHADYDKRYDLDPVHGAPMVLGSRKIAIFIEHFVLSKANMIMPIRESIAQKAIKNGAKPETIRVIPHGIDMTHFREPQKTDIYEFLGIGRYLKIISFIGRLSKENYVDDILELGKILSKERKDFIIVMVGGGNEEDRLKKAVTEDHNLNKIVRLIGFQPHSICIDLRRASAVSLCLMAGFSLIEACAAGRPIVAYDVEWHFELVRDAETGYLISEHDVEALAKHVRYLLDHPEDSDRMGRNAQTLAFENHDIMKTSMIKKELYCNLIVNP